MVKHMYHIQLVKVIVQGQTYVPQLCESYSSRGQNLYIVQGQIYASQVVKVIHVVQGQTYVPQL